MNVKPGDLLSPRAAKQLAGILPEDAAVVGPCLRPGGSWLCLDCGQGFSSNETARAHETATRIPQTSLGPNSRQREHRLAWFCECGALECPASAVPRARPERKRRTNNTAIRSLARALGDIPGKD